MADEKPKIMQGVFEIAALSLVGLLVLGPTNVRADYCNPLCAPPGQTCVGFCRPNPPCNDKDDPQHACEKEEMACRTKCALPQLICPSQTGAVLPKYYVIGLVYSPPGCSSSSALKCSAVSAVDYQAGSSQGTKTSVEESFSNTETSSDDASFSYKIGGIFSLDASDSNQFGLAIGSSDSHSQTLTKGSSLTIHVNGNEDGVDHNQDQFILWVNPAVVVQATPAIVNNNTCNPASNVVKWTVALTGQQTEQLLTVSVSWLKNPKPDPSNPSAMPASVAAQLQALGFTDDDYTQILQLDPFANGGTTIDQKRFAPTTWSFPYEPPSQASDCNNGVCSCLSFSGTIKNEFQTQDQTQSDFSVPETTDFKFGGGILGIKIGGGDKNQLTWKVSASAADTKDSTQSATATIQCPAVGYNGPLNMAIWWDTLFGSFLFVPTTPGGQSTIIHQGELTNASGAPVRGEPVTLSIGPTTFHTVTNKAGMYVFRASASYPGAGQAAHLAVRGVVKEVTVGASTTSVLRIP
jgi:hypothetical protein